jgi:cell division protein FtsB
MAYRKPNKPRTHMGSPSATPAAEPKAVEPEATTDAIPAVRPSKVRNVPSHDTETSEIPRVAPAKSSQRATGNAKRAAASSSSKNSEKSGPKSAAPKSAPSKKPATKEHRRAKTRAELSGAVKAPKISGHSKEIADAKAHKKHEVAGEPVPAKTFSGKLIVWAVVGLALLAFLFPTVGTFVKQQQEISALRESIAAKTAEQEQLKQEIARWDDPEYIKQQARDRINLVMPGERKYMVIGATGEDANVPENQSPNEVRTDLPWADALWDTVKRAATD